MTLGPVLDPKQLNRIEAVHRGFLYQYLYAVHLMLSSLGSDVQSITMERDEDMEVRRPGLTVYVQVKTRVSALTPIDIAGALDRLRELREAHRPKERTGIAAFVILTNAPVSGRLASQLAAEDWPVDVALMTPETQAVHGLTSPVCSIPDALMACEAAACNVPFGGLAPATLVLKLAAIAQHAATDARSHAITAEEPPGASGADC